jgi:hypothetical protein
MLLVKRMTRVGLRLSSLKSFIAHLRLEIAT